MVISPCVSLASALFINPRINFYTNFSIFKDFVLKTKKGDWTDTKLELSRTLTWSKVFFLEELQVVSLKQLVTDSFILKLKVLGVQYHRHRLSSNTFFGEFLTFFQDHQLEADLEKCIKKSVREFIF